MADNTTLNPGASGDVNKSHDDGTAKWTQSLGSFFSGEYAALKPPTQVSQGTPYPVDDTGTLEALGLVTGRTSHNKFGYNAAVGVTEEDIQELGGTINFPTAATTVRIKSGGNAADTAAGLGARAVTVQGLNASLALATESIVTAGASASLSTSTSFWRIFRAWVTDCGTYGAANTAAITIEDTAGSNDLILIDTERGQSQTSLICVPDATTLIIKSGTVVIESTKTASVFMYQRQNLDDFSTPFTSRRLLRRYGTVSGSFPIETNGGIAIPAKTDVWFAGATGSGTTGVSVDYSALFVAD